MEGLGAITHLFLHCTCAREQLVLCLITMKFVACRLSRTLYLFANPLYIDDEEDCIRPVPYRDMAPSFVANIVLNDGMSIKTYYSDIVFIQVYRKSDAHARPDATTYRHTSR
jgi:hypothetical protein